MDCHLWGCTESDTTEATQQQQQHYWTEAEYSTLLANPYQLLPQWIFSDPSLPTTTTSFLSDPKMIPLSESIHSTNTHSLTEFSLPHGPQLVHRKYNSSAPTTQENRPMPKQTCSPDSGLEALCPLLPRFSRQEGHQFLHQPNTGKILPGSSSGPIKVSSFVLS